MENEAKVIDQAARLLHSGEGNEEFVSNVHEWTGIVNGATLHSLLPLAVACLLLHEMWFSTQENRAFRVWPVLLRIVGCGALLAGYGRVVGLLTGLLGGAGAWPSDSLLIDGLKTTAERRMETFAGVEFDDLMGVLGHFLLWILLFMVDCFTAFFAYAVIFLLTKFQALMLVIFIAAGKTCIVLSLVPGVGLAKTWARALATLAAWGWMGGLVFSAVGGLNINVVQSSHSINIGWHFQLWIFYILLGIFAASIPKLVGMLASGAVSGAPSIAGALGAAYAGVKLSKAGVKLGAGTAKVTAGAAKLGGAGLQKLDGATGGHGGRALNKAKRVGNTPVGQVASAAGAAAGAAANRVAGAPVRSAAMSVAMRSGGVGSGAQSPASPISSPAPLMAQAPGAVARSAKAAGSWDVPAGEKSSEQWHDEGWRSTNGPSARPKAQPGYSSHKVTSGWDANGKDQYQRWVQVPNKMHGPVAPTEKPTAGGTSGMAGAKSLSAQALAGAPQPGRVGSTAPSPKTVGKIANESASSVSSRPVERPPSRSDISSAIERANEEESGGRSGAVYANSTPAPTPPVSLRRGGKQER